MRLRITPAPNCPAHSHSAECDLEKLTTPAGRQQPAIPPLTIRLQWHALAACTPTNASGGAHRLVNGERMTTADKESPMQTEQQRRRAFAASQWAYDSAEPEPIDDDDEQSSDEDEEYWWP